MGSCFVDAVEYTDAEWLAVQRPLRWPLDMSCCPHKVAEAKARQLQAAAIDLMFAQTGGRFTLCTDTFRPCPTYEVCGGCGGWGWGGAWGGGGWPGGAWCSCAVSQMDLLSLTWGPVTSIVQIKVHDGVTETVVPTTDYALVGGRYLRPYRGGALGLLWPSQDLQVPYGSALAPTWQVTLRHGIQPPPSVLVAAQDLACQLMAYCVGAPCDLPANAVSVTREGVTIRLESGLLAIPTVKIAVDTYPRSRKRSRLVDPSVPLGVAL